MDNVLEFACRLIEESGGAVEWGASRGHIEALLPEDVQERLGVTEPLVTISGGAKGGDEEKGIPIGFGTELLDKSIPMAMEAGQTAAVRMPAPSGRKTSRLEPEGSFSFPNAAFRSKRDHDSWQDYWLWSFFVTADADERREAVVHACVSAAGAGCQGLPERVLDQAAIWEGLKTKDSEFSEKNLSTLFSIACDRVLNQMDTSLTGFEETVTRHYERDIHRIETYFQDMCQEMEVEIKRRHLKGEELNIRKEKMAQLEDEKSRKLAALKEKYRIRLTLNPFALLLARIPVRRCDIQVKRRKKERLLGLVYNNLSRQFDPMVCEACGADTYTLGFCDDALHLLCAACTSTYVNQKSCPRCKGKAPASTIQGVLRRLGIEAAGQTTRQMET